MAWVRHRFVRSASGAISNILRKKATPTGSRGLLATRPHVRVTSSAVCAESAITQTRSYAETTGGGWMRTNSRKSGELSEVCSQTELGFGTGLKTSAWVLVGRRSRNMCFRASCWRVGSRAVQAATAPLESRTMLYLFAALGCSALQQPAAPPPLLRPGESRVVGGCLVEHRGDLLRLCSSVEPENIQVVFDRTHPACAHMHVQCACMQTQRAHYRSTSRSGTWRAAAHPTTPA